MSKDNYDKLLSLYFDQPQWEDPVKVDDFLVAVGLKQSNSVYHIAEVKSKPHPEKRIIRYYLKCYRSDLITALSREIDQRLIPMVWYNRKKRKQNV